MASIEAPRATLLLVTSVTFAMLSLACKGPIIDRLDSRSVQTAGEVEESPWQPVATILDKKCKSCHNESGTDRLRDVTSEAAVLKSGLVTAGLPNQSVLLTRIASGSMPPEDPLSADEQELIRVWIEGLEGALEFISIRKLNAAIAKDLEENVESDDRKFARYLSFDHLLFTDDKPEFITSLRSDLGKALNSLSNKTTLVSPKMVDARNTVYRIDLRDYGWDEDSWTSIEEKYPYTAAFKGDKGLASLRKDTGAELPVLKADWFINIVTVPPLYYDLQKLPKKLSALEAKVGVDLLKNIKDKNVIRSGYVNSSVAVGHRIIERHKSPDGFLWRSFEFADNLTNAQKLGTTVEFSRSPVGPAEAFPGGFQHAGTEIIYTLPNGLFGFYVADQTGKRLNAAPNVTINNVSIAMNVGQTCMHCHKAGLINRADQVRARLGAFNLQAADLEFAQAVYVDVDSFKQQIKDDNKIYFEALSKLDIDSDTADAIFENSKIWQPTTALTLERMAGELNVKVENLQTAFANAVTTPKDIVAAVKSQTNCPVDLVTIENGGMTRATFDLCYNDYFQLAHADKARTP